MEEKHLPTGIKLDILKQIARKKSSASEISKALKMSLPYALTQLTLLEAKEFLKATTNNNKQIGKPKKIYELTKDFLEITLLGEGFGDRFTSNNIDPQLRTYLRILSKVKEQNKSNFSEYYWSKIKYLKENIALGIIKETTEEVELLTITTREHLTILREQISTFTTSSGFKISCWVNTEEEFIEGIRRQDEYYIKLMKKVKPMLDKEKVFERLGELLK